MHRISFKATLQDRLEELVSSLRYASLLHRVILCGRLFLFLIGLLLMLYTLLLSCYHQYHPTNWPLVPWPPHPFSLILGWLVGIFLGYNILWNAVLDNERDVRLFPEHVVLKRRIRSNVIGWQDVTALSDAGAYLHLWFCQDTPNVIVVPKSAFSSLKGAEAFYTIVLDYWQDATGKQTPIPETAGVWPPAPRPSNSAEPDNTREG